MTVSGRSSAPRSCDGVNQNMFSPSQTTMVPQARLASTGRRLPFPPPACVPASLAPIRRMGQAPHRPLLVRLRLLVARTSTEGRSHRRALTGPSPRAAAPRRACARTHSPDASASCCASAGHASRAVKPACRPARSAGRSHRPAPCCATQGCSSHRPRLRDPGRTSSAACPTRQVRHGRRRSPAAPPG